MIKLTKLSGDEFVLNSDLILYIEARPDTYVTLMNNDRLVVRESVDEVVSRRIAYSNLVKIGTGAV